MIESLYIAETGMHSQQKMLDIISNNIANASTPGFKKVDVNFVDLVSKKLISQFSASIKQGNALVQLFCFIPIHYLFFTFD